MCILRIVQRKKFIAHVKSVNNSEFYCDGLHKSLNPDYATTPCLQHGVVSVDGKLIPFTYPTNSKQAILWNGQTPLPHSSTAITTATDNGTIRLNTNPMNRLDNNENIIDNQENFYHTLTPFSTQSQYEEHICPHNQTHLFNYTSERSTCPIHHRIINYPSDTFPLNIKDNSINKKVNGIVLSPHAHHLHHHHHSFQRHQKPKRITTPIINESMFIHLKDFL
jgi:hypothetical protein